MKIQPVNSYREPAYPTRTILDTQPELLRLTPRRWQRSAVVVSALATAGLLASVHWGLAAEQPGEKSLVAPLFIHAGRTERMMLGGDRPAPMYLTEADARVIITDEAQKAGIAFTDAGQMVKDIPIPQDFPAGARRDPQMMTLVLDGTDAKRKIAFEYVSGTDTAEWRKDGQAFQHNHAYEPQEVAQVLRDSLVAAHPQGAYGVFYDPRIEYSDAYENATTEDGKAPDGKTVREEGMMLARYELRQQVREFIAWLKAQKAI